MNTHRRSLSLCLFLLLGTSAALAGHPRPGDVAPGVLDESVDPPIHRATGDGEVDVSDVIVTLRAAVRLVEIQHDETQEQELEDLRARVATLEALLAHFSRDGDDLFVTGANLHLRNGAGSTSETNGLGNLVLGYNEPRGFLEDDRSGSHVLVIGSRNNYSAHSGLVVGEGHELLAPWASVTAGTGNVASGFASHVAGGRANVAAGAGASVLGGFGNLAGGEDAAVAGGSGNEALGPMATVAGGTANGAEGIGAAVSGGLLNVAAGEASTVGGGEGRLASGESDWRAGSLSEDD